MHKKSREVLTPGSIFLQKKAAGSLDPPAAFAYQLIFLDAIAQADPSRKNNNS